MLVNSFRTISQSRHRSVIIISHQERIMKLADEIIVIANGRITRQGPQEEIFSGLLAEISEGCDFGGKAGA